MKRSIYVALAGEGQFYLPPMDECPATFLSQCVKGTKKMLERRKVKRFKFPKFPFLDVAEIYDVAINDPELRQYVPDRPANKKRPRTLSKEFIFNSKYTPTPTSLPTYVQSSSLYAEISSTTSSESAEMSTRARSKTQRGKRSRPPLPWPTASKPGATTPKVAAA